MNTLKRILPFAIIFLLINACTISEAPTFQKINNVKSTIINLDQLTISADVTFHNPNDIGCELVATNIDVIANGVNLGKVNQTDIISIDNNSQFTLPTSISFSPKKVFKKNGGLLNGALNVLTSKEIDIRYLGSVTLRKAGIAFDIEIDETQTIPLKK